MMPLEFEFEMKRLNENFKNFYSKSKIKVIANIVEDIPVEFFSKCVEKIMWADKPPKIEWFQQLVSSYYRRQQAYAEIDDFHKQENSIFSDGDISMMKEFARRRMNGQLSDDDYYNFLACITEMVARNPKAGIKCPTCLDRGFAVVRNVGLQKCPKGCVEVKDV